jgi:hypothetical protein
MRKGDAMLMKMPCGWRHGRMDVCGGMAVPEGYGFVVNRVESEVGALCPDRQLPHGQVCRR